jgi:cell wall-associated NlpC family hydrolase
MGELYGWPTSVPAPAKSDARTKVVIAMAAYTSAQGNVLRSQTERQSYASMIGVQADVSPEVCPDEVATDALRNGASIELCRRSVVAAATPLSARAVAASFRLLGTPYACEGAGRLGPAFYDCSSLVAAAYTDAGFTLIDRGWAPSTRDMFPWDGMSRASWAVPLPASAGRPGDLALYVGSTHHVVIILTDGFMLHTASCGDVAHVRRLRPLVAQTGFRGLRRVTPPSAA